MYGLIGRKIGMTQVFDWEGNRVAVTAIAAGPCTVVRIKRSTDKDGYDAVVLGFEPVSEQRLTKPLRGAFKAAGVEPRRILREFRLSAENLAELAVGDELTVAMFQVGDYVDVTAWSKGRGFAGVIKRHNMRGASATHGTHEYFRHVGSVGMATYPGRVLKGKRMPGRYGNERVTVQNLFVEGVLPDENLLLVRGSVPGPRNGLVLIRASLKKKVANGQQAA